MKKQILVVGGAGYIGAHVAKSLHSAGFEPVVIDSLVTGHRQAVRWGPFHQLDIRDQSKLEQTLVALNFVAIVHLAAFVDVGESTRDPLKYFENNVGGTLSLLSGLKRLNRKVPIVFSSTAAVYGQPGLELIDETCIVQPINPYGKSKATVESILQNLWRSESWPSLILRYFNVAGADPDGEAGENHEPETHVIPNLLQSVLKDQAHFKLFGQDYPTPDGTCVRDYVHVSDLADAHVAAVEALLNSPNHDVFNIGYSKGFSVLEVLRAVEKVTGHVVNVKNEARRPGDPPSLVSDARRARTVLGWQPRFDGQIEQIVQHAWNWIRR